ncbi:MAG: MBL fold metallo-hydrolase [Gammaproteobacteria bacterium]|nr:MBL fold metallo-hydrolase [Gammaproteobacteria bacterium]
MNNESTAMDTAITLIDVHYTRPQLVGCYLLQQGDEVAVIETGTAPALAYVDAALRQRGISDSQVRYVIPTHVHLDHAGASGQMMQRFSEATLLAHPRGARHLIDPQKLIEGTIAVYGEANFSRIYGELLPVAATRVREISDGECYDLGGRTLQVFDTPGHARHHFVVWDAQSRGIFSGDIFGLGYPELRRAGAQMVILPSTPVQFEPQVWHQTLDRLLTLAPQRIYLTHFGMAESPAALVAQLHQQLDDYVELAEADQSEAELLQVLLDYQWQRATAMGFTFDKAAFSALFKFDMGLCAQGLRVWRERQR